MSQYLKEGAVDLFITYKFVKLLTTPWKKTEAFDAGVIDANGKLLVKVKDQSSAQKKNQARKILPAKSCREHLARTNLARKNIAGKNLAEENMFREILLNIIFPKRKILQK